MGEPTSGVTTNHEHLNGHPCQPQPSLSVEGIDEDTSDIVSDLRAPAKSCLKSTGSQLVHTSDRFPNTRAVSWQDFQGKELHTVQEYQPR